MRAKTFLSKTNNSEKEESFFLETKVVYFSFEHLSTEVFVLNKNKQTYYTIT